MWLAAFGGNGKAREWWENREMGETMYTYSTRMQSRTHDDLHTC